MRPIVAMLARASGRPSPPPAGGDGTSRGVCCGSSRCDIWSESFDIVSFRFVFIVSVAFATPASAPLDVFMIPLPMVASPLLTAPAGLGARAAASVSFVASAM